MKEFDKLHTAYWKLAKYDDLPFEHNAEVDPAYIHPIIDRIIEGGYNVMILSNIEANTATIMIDKGRFKQS